MLNYFNIPFFKSKKKQELEDRLPRPLYITISQNNVVRGLGGYGLFFFLNGDLG